MKVLLFFSGQSSLSHIFSDIFQRDGNDVEIVNYLSFIKSSRNRLFEKAGKLPRRFETMVREDYIQRIQKEYLKVIEQKKPDLIFIYNDQMLLPQTIDKISSKIKIGMFLADSPLFLQKRAHVVGLIRKAHFVFAPDTYWIEQCRMLGVKNIEYLIPGYNSTHHFALVKSSPEVKRHERDIFFMGSPYPDNWGYKRAIFLSKFCQFDFKFLGATSWRYWFNDFPELEKHFMPNEQYLSDEELNIMMNGALISPVDANPGIINGIHIRALDCIAAGVFPLIEYRKDLESIFKGVDVKFIESYDEIPEITSYYLKNDNIRNALIKQMQEKVLGKFTPAAAYQVIASSLKFQHG